MRDGRPHGLCRRADPQPARTAARLVSHTLPLARASRWPTRAARRRATGWTLHR